MKKFVLGFISASVLVGVAYGSFTFLSQSRVKKQNPLYDNDVKVAKDAVICDTQKHSCSYFDKTQQYYVKLTNNNGVALFNNLPSGDYAIYFNGVNFPKEYGDSPTVPVEIVKNQTTERVIELTPKR